MASLSSPGAIVSFSHFVTEMLLQGQPHSGIYSHVIISQWTPHIDLRSTPVSLIFTLQPLMVRFHIRVYVGVRHSFSSVNLCCSSTVLTEFISQIKHVLQQAEVFPPNISMLEMLEHFDHGDFARRVLFYQQYYFSQNPKLSLSKHQMQVENQ